MSHFIIHVDRGTIPPKCKSLWIMVGGGDSGSFQIYNHKIKYKTVRSAFFNYVLYFKDSSNTPL